MSSFPGYNTDFTPFAAMYRIIPLRTVGASGVGNLTQGVLEIVGNIWTFQYGLPGGDFSNAGTNGWERDITFSYTALNH